jgi:uncharacterized protein Yka (UPF0111/DUF47 family)
MSNLLSILSKAMGTEDDSDIDGIAHEITDVEATVDALFDDAAAQIMEVEFLNVNPDYLLEVAKKFDLISDLIERCALLFQYLKGFSDIEVSELVTTATAEINQIGLEFVECLKVLSDDRQKVTELCGTISEREKTLDNIRERFNSYAIQKMGATENRIWLKDIFGYLDQIADLSRDVTMTFRVIASKLERQRVLDVKSPNISSIQ